MNLVYYEPLTGRNIPKVFWDFLNLNGPIYANGQYTTGPLNQPWFFASGLPVTDAYWANVKVAGKQVDVLIQAYERRVLTYIPAYNGSPFNVQMGNVGQHYYNWRYKGQGCAGAPPPAPSTPLPGATPPAATPTAPAAACDQGVPAATSATITPRCGPDRHGLHHPHHGLPAGREHQLLADAARWPGGRHAGACAGRQSPRRARRHLRQQ